MTLPVKALLIPLTLGAGGLAAGGGVGLVNFFSSQESFDSKENKDSFSVTEIDSTSTQSSPLEQQEHNHISEIPKDLEKQREDALTEALKESNEPFAHYVHKELGKEKDILTCTRLFSEEITDKEEFKEEECQNFLVKEVFEGTNHAGESVMWLRTNQENFESIFAKFFDFQ